MGFMLRSSIIIGTAILLTLGSGSRLSLAAQVGAHVGGSVEACLKSAIDPATQHVEEEWLPGNARASVRHEGMPPVEGFSPPAAYRSAMAAAGQPLREVGNYVPEYPPFVDPATFIDHGRLFGPDSDFDAQFNPTAFVARDPRDGKQKIYMVKRGEKNLPDATWKRMSLPYLAVSEDGVHFENLGLEPWFKPTDSFEKAGGIEDCRYADLRLQPYIDSRDGKSFDGAIVYTGYDGSTARVGYAVFNHENPHEIRKIGLLFDPKEVRENPLVPGNPEWNKSDSILQYREPSGGSGPGEVVNWVASGEGNTHHGGIMVFKAKGNALKWKWLKNKKPSILAKPGTVTHGLVEPAFRPFLIKLPKWLKERTGRDKGIIVFFHGDAPPIGYSVKYAIFGLDDAAGKPIYEAEAPFLWQKDRPPSEQVEKVNFASGAVVKDGRLFIYYGIGDSYIGAVSMKVNDLLLEP